MRPRLFLAIALPAGLLVAAATVPYGGPDEPGHLLRAWQLSEGKLLPPQLAGRSAGTFPSSLSRLAESFGVPHAAAGWSRSARAAARDGLAARLAPTDRQPMLVPPGGYSPVPYLPYVLAIAAGRLAGASPLLILLAARLAGLVTTTLLHALALKLAPSVRLPLALLALAPTPLFLRAVVSADGMTIALAHLVFALALRRAAGENASQREDAGLVVAAILLGLCKTVYTPLALLPLVLPRAGSRRAAVAALAFAAAAAGAWTVVTAGLPPAAPPDRPVDPQAQLRAFREHPLEVSAALVAETATRAPNLAREAVGHLGWLDVRLPLPLLIAWALTLGLEPLLEGTSSLRLASGYRAWLLAAALPSAFLVLFSQFLMWTLPGTPLAGVSGRYFLPILPPLLFALVPKRPVFQVPETARNVVAAVLTIASALVSAAALSGLASF